MLLILQDYQVYQEGGHAGINWGKIGEMFDAVGNVAKPLTDLLKPLIHINEEMAHWVDSITGIPGLFHGVELALLAVIGKLLIAKGVTSAWSGLLNLIRGRPAVPGAPAAAGGTSLIWRMIRAAPTALRLGAIGEAFYNAISDPKKWWKDWGEAGSTGHFNWGTQDPTKHKAPWEGWFTNFIDRMLKGPESVQKESAAAREGLGRDIGKGIVQAMRDITGAGSDLFLGPGEKGFGVDTGTGGRPGGGGGGGFGGGGGAGYGGLGDPDVGGTGDASELGLSAEQWAAFRGSLGGRESGNRYRIVNSYGYMGKYQFGAREVAETAKSLGEPVPSKADFLNDPAMQERYFLRYTIRHNRQLMGDAAFAKLSPIERAAFLGVAHLKGTGGAQAMLHGGSAGSDAYGTTGSSYYDMIKHDLYRARLVRPATGEPSAGKGAAPVQNNHTTVNVAAGPTAEATGSRVTSGMQYINQQRYRQFSDLVR